MKLHWSAFVLMGGVLNALVNYGYKMISHGHDSALFTAMVFGVTAVVFIGYGIWIEKQKLGLVLDGKTPLLASAMGLAKVATMVLFVAAFAQAGPISLVDPMWACVYSLGSVLIGVYIVRERPKLSALAGIALFMVGAFLMARG